MYLFEKAVRESLAAIAQSSAKQSTLILTYLTPHLTHGRHWLDRTAARGLGLLAEPLRFEVSPDGMSTMLQAYGFEPFADLLPAGEAARYGAVVSPLALRLPRERVVLSVRER